MTTIAAALTFKKIGLAAGQTFGKHQVTLKRVADGGVMTDVERVSTTEGEVTFDDLEPGRYVVIAYSVDAAGIPLSPPVSSDPIDVVAPPVVAQADVVSSITVRLA